MFAPPFRRVSPSPGPSSVQPWFLLYTVVIAALFAVASTSYSDICGTNFANQMHTIGPIDGDLWAITKDNWTVYKLTPCKPGNGSLVHCMEVGEPVSIDNKWPELAKSVKVAANKTDYSFTFDKSVIGYSSDFKDTVLAMYGTSFNKTGFFGFRFVANESIVTRKVDYEPPVIEGSWISSDDKGKSYRIYKSGKQIDQIGLYKPQYDINSIQIAVVGDSTKNICNVGTSDFQVNFTTQPCASPEKTFTFNVSRGVLYNKQFYLFGSDIVYIFLDKAEQTELVKLSYKAFFPCKPPTTLAPLTSSNQTRSSSNESVSTRPSATWTTTTGSNMGMIIGIVIISLLILLVLVVGGYYFLVSKREKQAEQALSSQKLSSKMAAPSKVVTSGGKQAKSSAGASKQNFKMDSKAKSMTKLKANSKATSKATYKGNSNGKSKTVSKKVLKAGSKVSSQQGFPPSDESEILQRISEKAHGGRSL